MEYKIPPPSKSHHHCFANASSPRIHSLNSFLFAYNPQVSITTHTQVNNQGKKRRREKKKTPTRISQNPYLSSNLRYGFFAPPSLSISPAHSLQLIGFNFSAPRTRPRDTNTSETRVSTTMSCGRAVEVRRALLERTVCSWAE